MAKPHFKNGDRVRMIGFDYYTGITEGSLGTCVLIKGYNGNSVYPDPCKILLRVKFDNGITDTVPVRLVEKCKVNK
jgi:hypothetical protein